LSYLNEITSSIREEIAGKYYFGNPELLELLMVAFFSRGHVLIEGPPGTGKTITSKILAELLSKAFSRVQFTSDMLPADLLGASIYSPESRAFQFLPGPIFAEFILADEINRTPPRTQSALLEAMEERQVTIEGKRMPLSADFFVVATQNPQDYEGTFPLPEVQLDRFLFKLAVTHSDAGTESRLLEAILAGQMPPPFGSIRAVPIERGRLDEELRATRVDASLVRYTSAILEATRRHPALVIGSSVRGGIGLVNSSRVRARMLGREFVTPDDIKSLALPVLAHRIRLAPEASISGLTEAAVVQEILTQVPFPA